MSKLNKLKQKYEDGGKAEKIKGLTKSLKGEASIGPIPRSKAAEFVGDKVAGAIRSARAALPAEVPVLGGTVGEWIFGQAPEALEDWSYGFGPVRLGRTDVAGPAGALYGMKADPRMLDVAGAAEIPYIAGKVGLKGAQAAAKRVAEAMKNLPEADDLAKLKEKYQAGGRVGKTLEVGKRFFSAIDKAIDTLKQPKGTGEQMYKQIEQTPGVKKEELKYRGVEKIKESPKITKEQIKETVAAKPAPIPERRILGTEIGIDEEWAPNLSKEEMAVLEEIGVDPVVNPDDRRMLGFMIRDTGDIVDIDTLTGLDAYEMGFPVDASGKLSAKDNVAYKTLMQAVRKANSQFQTALSKKQPKFSQYSLGKGGGNYREVLVKLPKQEGRSRDLNEIAMEMFGKKFGDLGDEEADIVAGIERRQNVSFRSGHYDDPNVVTHFRVSDMKGPNGEKVLYVDEIQSDWHQKARDARKDYIKKKLKAAESEIHEKAVNEATEKLGSTEITEKSLKELEKIKNRIRREYKTQFEEATPKDFGYLSAEDAIAHETLMQKSRRFESEGPTIEELQEFYQPGKLVKGFGGVDKVLDFKIIDGNEKEFSQHFNQVLEELSKDPAKSILGPNATPEDLDDHIYKILKDYLDVAQDQREIDVVKKSSIEGLLKHRAGQIANQKFPEGLKPRDWSVTVVSVDPGTGQPLRGETPRTHRTYPTAEMLQDLERQMDQYRGKMPDAPFKDTWHELAVKEILDVAAREGYDKVAFSPGIEQVKRYEQGLRQAVDEIKFVVNPDGELVISGIKDGSTRFGGRAVDGVFLDGLAEGKTLNEVFGREVAEQIQEQAKKLGQADAGASIGRPMPKMSADDLLSNYGDQMTEEQIDWLTSYVQHWDDNVDATPAGQAFESELTEAYERWLSENKLPGTEISQKGPNVGSIKTENLTIGGEGMKSFYDKRLPDFVRKYGEKEFGAPTSYVDLTYEKPKKLASEREISRMLNQIAEEDSDDVMQRSLEITHDLAEQRLRETGIDQTSPEWDNLWWDAVQEFQDRGTYQAMRELAIQRLEGTKGNVKAFAIDVTPKMREKITTEGQKLFAVPPAIGAIPAAQQSLEQELVQEPTEEVPQDQSEVPEGFQKGGRVGMAKEAAERLLRVLHGSPTKVTPESGRSLDVTTDPEYAIKRGQDKMMGTQGPPMVHKFDIPQGRLLRFEEEYSPEDVALMRRFFSKLPQGQAMTGEQIYEAAQGKDYVLEGLAKAGGFAGYQRPSGGAGGKGDWFRVTQPEELKRGKKAGGLAQAFSKSL